MIVGWQKIIQFPLFHFKFNKKIMFKIGNSHNLQTLKHKVSKFVPLVSFVPLWLYN